LRAGLLLAVIAGACSIPRSPVLADAPDAAPALAGAVVRHLPEPVSRSWGRPLALRAPDAVAAAQVVPSVRPAGLDATALRRAQRYVDTVGPWSHLCLRFVRNVYGLPARDRSAIAAWHEALSKHRGDPQPPAGVPVFWAGGGPGHVALSLGDGWVLTSDYPSSGHVTKVPITAIDEAWNLRYLGWTDDLEGVIVHR
jgi:cell wall-associated NlpC family hydrolase